MEQKLKRELQASLKTKKYVEAHRLLRAVCGPTRHNIIHLLNKCENGLTVTEIAQVLNSSLSKISHQLKILKGYKIVSTKTEGGSAIYSLADHKIKSLF